MPTPRIPEQALQIIELLRDAGATDAMIVGGFVRDFLLGVPSKDVDVEVYGLSYSQIRDVLSPHFKVDLVGQSFGVLKVGRDVDVALPRRESKAGVGHKGFDVEATPCLSTQEAFARRDFTVNAIGLRPDGSFCDPYDGIGDLKRKILRATSPAFKDDPLRVLRGMQFAARFGFSPEPRTVQFCRDVFSEFATLSEERIYEEWKKWALKGEYPERGLEFLRETGWIAGFPELNALVGCPQNPRWHPEGDVWTHTLAVCREAADAARDFRPELSEDERLALMFAALGHDFGKPSTTALDENGEIRSLGHAAAGVPLVREFLERMKAPNRVVESVVPLVAEHMTTQSFGPDGPSERTVRRLARRLDPANVKLWTLLCRSDAFGCGSTRRYLTPDGENAAQKLALSAKELEKTLKSELADDIQAPTEARKIRFQADVWLEIAERLDLQESAPKPILQGRDLVSLGIAPGPEIGEILRQAFEAQLDGEFSDVASGLEFLKARKLV